MHHQHAANQDFSRKLLYMYLFERKQILAEAS